MADFPLPFGFVSLDTMLNANGDAAVTAVTSGTSHVKTSPPTELIASTPYDAYGLTFSHLDTYSNNTNTAALFSIYVGAASSEVVLIDNINCGHSVKNGAAGVTTATNTVQSNYGLFFPVYIPAGTRISGAYQHVTGSSSISVHVALWGRPPGFSGTVAPLTVIDTIGAVTGSSRGTAHTAGSGSWQQLVASTTYDYSGFTMGIALESASTASAATRYLQIGVGGAGSETIIWKGAYRETSNEQVGSLPEPTMGGFIFAPGRIPAGTRLAFKTDATNLDLILYGAR